MTITEAPPVEVPVRDPLQPEVKPEPVAPEPEPQTDEERRVAVGAAWLDEVAPDWDARVDVDHIEMSECAACVFGQVFGASPSFAQEWGTDRTLEDRGFMARDPSDVGHSRGPEFRRLAGAWKREILRRRREQS